MTTDPSEWMKSFNLKSFEAGVWALIPIVDIVEKPTAVHFRNLERTIKNGIFSIFFFDFFF